jgi:hypothetical protein
MSPVTQRSAALLSPDEIRDYLRISRPTYLTLLAEGLPHVVVSRGPCGRARRRYDPARVTEWLAARESDRATRRRRGRPHAGVRS